MPAEWTTLPLHAGLRPPLRDSIAVYTMKMPRKKLVYEGYICPVAPEKMSMSYLRPPPSGESFGQKYTRLREKIIAEEAEAKAWAEISEHQRNRAADSAASSKPGQVVVRAEPSATPGREDAADELKRQIGAEAAATSEIKIKPEESNTDFSFPFEILDRIECLVAEPPEGGTEESKCCFEPWEDTMDSSTVELGWLY